MTFRYPDEAYDYINDAYSVSGIIKYAINWKKSRTVKTDLVPWLRNQVIRAQRDGFFDDVVENLTDNLPANDYDSIMVNVLRYVRSRVKYKTDSSVWKVKEYWQGARVTWSLRTGDCEDGAVLIYVLASLCGVPSNRMLVFAGDVKGGGHCWLGYKPTFDVTKFAFMDWCYWYDQSSVRGRELFYILNNKVYQPGLRLEDDLYHKVWWGFNEDEGYLHINTGKISTKI